MLDQCLTDTYYTYRNKTKEIFVKNHGKKPQGFLKEVEKCSCEITRK